MPKDRERLLRALFDRAPEAIVIADHTRRIVDINETMVEMFGYHIDEIAGEPTAVLYADPLDFQESGRAVFSQNVPAAEAPGVLRQRYKRKDGSVFNARTVAMQLRDANGHVRGFAGRIEDMSDRDAEHSAEVEALSTERALLDALYRKTPAMLFATDTEGSIEHISDSLADRLGVSAAEAFGRAWTDFLMEPSATRPGDLFREVEQAGRIVDTPHRLRGRDGVLVEVELSATLETSGQHQRVLAILSNVTARNRAIKELESRNAQMRQFARIAAHDLRTPLRHISLFADDVHKALEHADVPDVLDDLGVIRKSAERLSEMVKGLLEFSVTNEKKIVPERVDMGPLMAGIVACYAHEIACCDARIEIGELPVVTCDPVLIERVFENLLSNALKFRDAARTPEIDISARRAQSSWVFEVRDNGIGINPAFHDRIFDPLSRLHGVDSEYKGNGIGLSLAHRIVDAHGGRIWVDSEESQGSSFFVELPTYL